MIFDLNQIDPKTSLQEWSQSHKYGMPYYETISKSGLAHMPEFTVRVSAGTYKEIGSGNSIKVLKRSGKKNC